MMTISVLIGSLKTTGIAVTDDERAACQTSGCTVWTAQELQELALRFFKQEHDSGYAKGKQARGTAI